MNYIIYEEVYNRISNSIRNKTMKKKALHFCSHLTIKTIKNIDNGESPNNFHSFHSKYLHNTYGGRYKDVLKKLIELDILVANNSYSNDGLLNISGDTFTKGYAIHRNYQTKCIIFQNDYRVVQQMKTITEMYKKLNKDNILKELLKNLRKIEFNKYEDIEEIESLFDVIKSVTPSDTKALHTYNSLLEPYRCFLDDEIRIIRDESGRIHTPFTRLSKLLRSDATLNGDKLSEIDITASIPQALGVWLKRHKFDDQEELLKFENDLRQDIYKVLIDNHMTNIDRNGLSEKEFRDVIKKELLACFNHKRNTGYSKSHSNGETKFYAVYKVFKERYPKIWDFIVEYKAVASEIDPENGYKSLGYDLMALEADVMIDIMVMDCKRMKIPLITLHDALFVTRENRETVKEQLEFRLKQAGWVGLVKVEDV